MTSIEHYVVVIATDMCDGQVEDDRYKSKTTDISRLKTIWGTYNHHGAEEAHWAHNPRVG